MDSRIEGAKTKTAKTTPCTVETARAGLAGVTAGKALELRAESLRSSFRGATLVASPESIRPQGLSHHGFRVRAKWRAPE
ncbi:hypothetical protein ABIE85_005989 [Bradyrhizobium diazoefficiens]|jgi:hypothetical protein